MTAGHFHQISPTSWLRVSRRSAVALGAASLLVLAAGCGDDNDDSGGAAASDGGTPASVLDVDLSEFKVELSTSEVATGSVTINANNKGTIEHELVIVKSDADSAALPQVEGKVPEDEVEVIDEIKEFKAGTTASGTFDLAPGKYLLICNIPAHYSQGMHAPLTVTG
ncbi:MAG: phospho-sugar glycosidase domain-containing protein [Acidimicrobiia bacterium]